MARLRVVIRTTSVVLLLALVAAGCGDDDETSPTTTDGATTTTTSTTEAPTTTTSEPLCEEVEVPAAATDVIDATGDVDGDGHLDALHSYRLGDEWHLHTMLTAGGGADGLIRTSPDSAVAVLGGADVDGDGADEALARTGSGASAVIVGLFRLSDCALTQVTLPGGDPAEFAVGGSVGSAAGLECDAHVDPDADLTMYTAMHTGTDDTYEITATEYALDGTVLVEKGTSSSTVGAGDAAFERATTLRCDALTL